MDAVGRSVVLTVLKSKKRKIFRECTVTEYVYSLHGTYWNCVDNYTDETVSFDWTDIINGRVSFSPD